MWPFASNVVPVGRTRALAVTEYGVGESEPPALAAAAGSSTAAAVTPARRTARDGAVDARRTWRAGWDATAGAEGRVTADMLCSLIGHLSRTVVANSTSSGTSSSGPYVPCAGRVASDAWRRVCWDVPDGPSVWSDSGAGSSARTGATSGTSRRWRCSTRPWTRA